MPAGASGEGGEVALGGHARAAFDAAGGGRICRPSYVPTATSLARRGPPSIPARILRRPLSTTSATGSSSRSARWPTPNSAPKGTLRPTTARGRPPPLRSLEGRPPQERRRREDRDRQEHIARQCGKSYEERTRYLTYGICGAAISASFIGYIILSGTPVQDLADRSSRATSRPRSTPRLRLGRQRRQRTPGVTRASPTPVLP